ncbi:hypothetical protein Pcac1_g21271 [Phytophthora cactorum]|nr:hypothetical protein Pcac1_g21271 [Phytophthora cactorum]
MCDQGWQLDGGEADAGVEFGVAVAHREEQGQGGSQCRAGPLVAAGDSAQYRSAPGETGRPSLKNDCPKCWMTRRKRLTMLLTSRQVAGGEGELGEGSAEFAETSFYGP